MTFQKDFSVDQGATFSFELSTDDEDWSNTNFRMQIREERDVNSNLLEDLNNNITVSSNTMSVNVSASNTESWDWEKGYYDLFMDRENGTTIKLLFGCVKVNKRVTE